MIMTINIFKGDCKITLEEEEDKGGKGKGSLAAVGSYTIFYSH